VRKKLKWAGIIIALIFIGLQFTSPRHTNPSFDEAQTLQGMTTVPSEVSALFARSCNDCHSNKTDGGGTRMSLRCHGSRSVTSMTDVMN